MITQADRDAAKPIAMRVRIGELTEERLVQAFAAHRIAEREAVVKLIDQRISNYKAKQEKTGAFKESCYNQHDMFGGYAEALEYVKAAIEAGKHITPPTA